MARGVPGLVSYSFDPSTNNWTTLTTGPVIGGEETEYSTLQGFVLNGNAYVVFRSAATGVKTYRFTSPSIGNVNWVYMGGDIPLTDALGWNNAVYGRTMQTFVLGSKAYLIVRGSIGLLTYRFDGTSWQDLGPTFVIGGFSNGAGWTDPKYYETIRTFILNGAVYLIGRGQSYVQTYKLDETNGWQSPSWSPILTDATGWYDVRNYKTIRVFVHNNVAYLTARHAQGILTFRFDGTLWTLAPFTQYNPPLSDSAGWSDEKYYSTIRIVQIRNPDVTLMTALRSDGILTFKFDPTSGWSSSNPSVGGLVPRWPGWGYPQYYQTIRTTSNVAISQTGKSTAFLDGRDASGISHYSLSPFVTMAAVY